MSIQIVVLVSGLTLLGEVAEVAEGVVITHPVNVITVPSTPQKQGGLAFVPFLEYTQEFDTGIALKRDQILTIATPTEEIARKHQSIFSNLILPPSV